MWDKLTIMYNYVLLISDNLNVTLNTNIAKV